MGAPLLSSSSRTRPLRIAFCHPDLGLGGAERLIVDAAVELAERGHDVTIYTAHHDRSRAFAETVDGPFRVIVAGAWFPRSLAGGRAIALCAYVRCVLAALRIAWDGRKRRGKKWDAAIADQVSAVVPVLQRLLAAPAAVLFYCHFPDLLLARPRRAGSLSALLHALYRLPLDAVEQRSTGAADRVLVNSEFTAGVFASTFPRLARAGVAPRVLYPAASIPSDEALRAAKEGWREALPAEVVSLVEGSRAALEAAAGGRGEERPAVFVSINRFEGKKGLPLALRALGELDRLLLLRASSEKRNKSARAEGPPSSSAPAPPVLVFAGGFDARLPENASVLSDLRRLAAELGLSSRVAFLPSFSDEQRGALLAVATAVLYTPENEHFGIVPVEAAAAAVPVVACSSGGPRESVLDGETGFLRRPEPLEFARAMLELVDEGEGEGGGISGKKRAEEMGAAARRRAAAVFSRSAFGAELEREVRDMVERKEAEEEEGKRKKRR